MRREHPLASVERGMRVAARHRLDLIEEVEADVRALQAELERRGHSPAQARRAALRRFLPGSEALEQLEARHAPPPRRWARGARWLDHAVRLGVAAVAALAGTLAFTLPASGPPGGTAALFWLQALVTALLAANLAWVGAQLWIHGDLRPAGRRVLWFRHVGLILTAVAVGALGAAWKGRLLLIGADFATISSLSAWDAVRETARVASIGLATAIFGLFGWLVFTPRLITDEEMEGRIARFFARNSSPVALVSQSRPIVDSTGGR